MKRIFDIIGAVLGLFFIAPFAIFIALAIIIESGLPIFVGLDRVSGGKIIKVYKFRSMVRDAHILKKKFIHLNERADGPFFKIAKDPRVTKVGHFLRRLRLDEFAQFWNVLKGELSLIGPRPHELEEIDSYPDEFKELRFAKAGLTGLSQIKGASALPFMEEIKYDLYYVKNRSLFLDLKILLGTVKIFFTDPTGV